MMAKRSKSVPPTYFFAFLALSIALHFLLPLVKIIHAPYSYSGFVLIAFGAALNVWADYLLKANKTTVKPYEKPSRLVASGPFSISRNPQYLGFTAILLGVVMLHGTLTMFAFPVLFAIVMETMFIPLEERSLERAFGMRYLDYKRHVRRWI